MTIRTGHMLSAALTASTFAATAFVYGQLPDSMPVHWNVHGQVDGWIAKPWGPFVLPVTMLGVLALLMIVPVVSPRRYRIERFFGAYATIEVATLAFLAVLVTAMLWDVLGHPQAVSLAVPAASGLLFIVVGNYLGKVTRNFFVGIRTPWTLASDEVWLRTHRLGGKLFVAAGVVTLVSAPTGHAIAVLVASVLTASLIAVAHSYLIYRQLEGFSRQDR
jgi:immunity protein, SdpI family